MNKKVILQKCGEGEEEEEEEEEEGEEMAFINPAALMEPQVTRRTTSTGTLKEATLFYARLKHLLFCVNYCKNKRDLVVIGPVRELPFDQKLPDSPLPSEAVRSLPQL